MPLSIEQQEFIDSALQGENILVDACIGSGKTTAIQALCNEVPIEKRILYLTYNKLLKLDAKAKIRNPNCMVTNYHGFAYTILMRNQIRCGMGDLIQTFNRVKPNIPHFDLLILDEYQDIEEELAHLLCHIKAKNPGIQIIAVGDMQQKIYDKTTLQVPAFMNAFLGTYKQCSFTNCFRLSAGHAAMLGRIWQKNIHGVNENCQIIKNMNFQQACTFLEKQDPKDILCLGARTGDMATVLNRLESKKPNKFNKNTVYASIRDNSEGATEPTPESAIFTTFDSSKGMERKICMVFDFTESYWQIRAKQPMQSYEILRNIFCVAASRGKEEIIFVTRSGKEEELLTEKILATPSTRNVRYQDVAISDMFSFKYKEDVEKAFEAIQTRKLPVSDCSTIAIQNRDGLIDLSPCIGIYQEASFFKNYDIDKEIEQRNSLHEDRVPMKFSEEASLEQKILGIVAYDTHQNRYVNQVTPNFILEEEKEALFCRLQTVFSPEEEVQTGCVIPFFSKEKELLFEAKGRTDVIKNDIIYELKFVDELSHEMFLQCACYMTALDKEKGILWNVKKNEKYLIYIPDRKRFLNRVARAITKGTLKKYYSLENEPSKKQKKKPKKKQKEQKTKVISLQKEDFYYER